MGEVLERWRWYVVALVAGLVSQGCCWKRSSLRYLLVPPLAKVLAAVSLGHQDEEYAVQLDLHLLCLRRDCEGGPPAGDAPVFGDGEDFVAEADVALRLCGLAPVLVDRGTAARRLGEGGLLVGGVFCKELRGGLWVAGFPGTTVGVKPGLELVVIHAAIIVGAARAEHVVCTLDNTPALMGGPNCQTVGQQFDGFGVRFWRAEGGIMPLDEALAYVERLWLEAVPGASDEFGGSAPRVYATGKGRWADEAVHTSVLTALIARPADGAGNGPMRAVLVTSWAQEGSDWRFVSLGVAFVGGEEFLRPDPVIENFMDDWQRFQP